MDDKRNSRRYIEINKGTLIYYCAVITYNVSDMTHEAGIVS